MANLTPGERDTIERQLNFARALQIETRVIEGDEVTQIFVMRHRDRGLSAFLRRGLVLKIVSLAQDMQVTVVETARLRAARCRLPDVASACGLVSHRNPKHPSGSFSPRRPCFPLFPRDGVRLSRSSSWVSLPFMRVESRSGH
jgi:hypothetical protein